MNTTFSQIITGLFAKPIESRELSIQLHRLGDEVRSVFRSEVTLYGKFSGLLESFRTIIPDEKQRYQAALQALSTTTKLNRQEIIAAINNELAELNILEKNLVPSFPGWREELKAMDARLQALRSELSLVRERAAQLENEEKAVLAGMSARQQDLELADRTIGELFANIGAEITALNEKVTALTAEGPAAQPAPPPVQPVPSAAEPAPPPGQPVLPKDAPNESAPDTSGEGGAETIEIKRPPQPLDTKWQRKCPMCGGQMNLLELEHIWQCYTCAHEEPTNAVHDRGAPSSAFGDHQASAFSGDDAESKPATSPSGTRPATKKKTCPACRKSMFWYPDEQAWRCPSCGYERRI